MFPVRRAANPLSSRILKPSRNIGSDSRIGSEACLLTNKATKKHSSSISTNRANGIAIVEGSPIRYNKCCLPSILEDNVLTI